MNKSRTIWPVLLATFVCVLVYCGHEKAHASPIIDTFRAATSAQTSAQTAVYYGDAAFSVVYPPGSVVQVQHTTSEDTPPLAWTYYQGKLPNDARLIVGYADIDRGHTPPELVNQIDNSYNNMFIPGYSIKKEASLLDTLPAMSAAVSGFGQGSDVVQCHECTRYNAYMVVAWDEGRRRFWMLQTLAEPNELPADEVDRFLKSFKLK